MKTDNKTLSDVTRQNSANKANKFAASLMPTAPKSREQVEEPVAEVEEVAQVQLPVNTPTAQPATETNPTLVTPKTERAKKPGVLSVEDIVSSSAREGISFNKMVRVTDEHHELLRLMAFKYRKPMNVIVHNLIALLDQAYQKEQKGDQSNV